MLMHPLNSIGKQPENFCCSVFMPGSVPEACTVQLLCREVSPKYGEFGGSSTLKSGYSCNNLPLATMHVEGIKMATLAKKP